MFLSEVRRELYPQITQITQICAGQLSRAGNVPTSCGSAALRNKSAISYFFNRLPEPMIHEISRTLTHETTRTTFV